eukprot:1033186-Pyramimonas_sp.AAC.1
MVPRSHAQREAAAVNCSTLSRSSNLPRNPFPVLGRNVLDAVPDHALRAGRGDGNLLVCREASRAKMAM